MLKILQGSIVTGKSGKPLKVIGIDGDGLVLESDTGVVKAKRSAIMRIISAPPTGQNFHIGDRVTLLDKFMVRAADLGTIEAVTEKGLQVLWDNKIQHEPNLKQPPMLWRTFKAEELELIESKYQQN
jgi:uncharacterized protein YjlB